MANQRFHVLSAVVKNRGEVERQQFLVVEMYDPDRYFKFETRAEQAAAERAVIHVGGMVSYALAKTWAEQIANQLNQFDTANAAVAKLSA